MSKSTASRRTKGARSREQDSPSSRHRSRSQSVSSDIASCLSDLEVSVTGNRAPRAAAAAALSPSQTARPAAFVVDLSCSYQQQPLPKKAVKSKPKTQSLSREFLPHFVRYELTKFFREVTDRPTRDQRLDLWSRFQMRLQPKILPLSKITRWFQNERQYVKRRNELLRKKGLTPYDDSDDSELESDQNDDQDSDSDSDADSVQSREKMSTRSRRSTAKASKPKHKSRRRARASSPSSDESDESG